jgi:hypothetical protein
VDDKTFKDHEPNVPAQFVDPLDYYLQREKVDEGVAFDGTFVNFNGQTGVWSANKRPLLPGPALVNVYGTVIGWIKLEGGKITDRTNLGFLINGYVPPDRESLGDLDESRWSYNNGRREDPWKKVAYLQMTIGNQNFIYAPFAPTQVSAVNAFIAMFRRERVRAAGKFPLVELDARDFTNNSGGTTFAPVFRVVGWGYLDGAPAPEPPMVEVKPKPLALDKPKPAKKGDMDDDIPF